LHLILTYVDLRHLGFLRKYLDEVTQVPQSLYRQVERLERAMVSERRGTSKGAGRCSYETYRHEEEKNTTYQSYDNSMLLKSSSANMFCFEL
jgi:hypothetical protein